MNPSTGLTEFMVNRFEPGDEPEIDKAVQELEGLRVDCREEIRKKLGW
jgi:hypothetical protein